MKILLMSWCTIILGQTKSARSLWRGNRQRIQHHTSLLARRGVFSNVIIDRPIPPCHCPTKKKKNSGSSSSQWSRAPSLQLRNLFLAGWRGGGSDRNLDENRGICTKDLASECNYSLSKFDFPVSVCSIRGCRSYMEDDFVVAPDFCGVFDGHGGKAISRYLRQNLYANLQAALPAVRTVNENEKKNKTTINVSSNNDDDDDGSKNIDSIATMPTSPSVEDYENAFRAALDRIDREVQRISHWSYQGSTAVGVWLHEGSSPSISKDIEGIEDTNSKTIHISTKAVEDDNDRIQSQTRTLIIANIGDSRAILSRDGSAIDLTRDHKPNDPIELERITATGGCITWHGDEDADGEPIPGTGIYRVNGNLALSRAIGDRSERPAVSAEPDISKTILQEEDEFVVLATDGLWDAMTSSEVVAFIHMVLAVNKEVDREDIASMLVEEALHRGTYDNVTVIIVWLFAAPKKVQEGEEET